MITMKNKYKETFDAVMMPSAHKEKIRASLSEHFAATHGENVFTKRKIRPRRSLVIAAAIVLALALVGFTFGNQIINLLSGGRFMVSTSDGTDIISVTLGSADVPIRVQENQIYFVIDGSDENITNQCSNENYYQYEVTDELGYRHVILIGGTPDNVGWAEMVWDSTGKASGCTAVHNSEEEPEWLISGKAAFGF